MCEDASTPEKKLHPSWLEEPVLPEDGMFFRIEYMAFGIYEVVLRKPRKWFGSRRITAVPIFPGSAETFDLTNEQLITYTQNHVIDRYWRSMKHDDLIRFIREEQNK